MVNRAARYYPILRELQSNLRTGSRILEIGSGAQGIGQFYRGPFIGCDIAFSQQPKSPLIPVICSGTELPFADASFDVVIASDVMEHVPPNRRAAVIGEALRVARDKAIFGFPCGPRAFEVDKKLSTYYEERRIPLPVWLEEHMQFPFPGPDLLQALPDGWNVRGIFNESLGFHYWLMRMETYRLLNYCFRLSLVTAPKLVESVLRIYDHEPSYRMIFIATRSRDSA